MNRTKLRKQVLSLPMNSILYIDVPKEDGAKLCLERIKLSALDCLLRSNFSEKERDENSSVKEITEEYTKTFSNIGVQGVQTR